MLYTLYGLLQDGLSELHHRCKCSMINSSMRRFILTIAAAGESWISELFWIAMSMLWFGKQIYLFIYYRDYVARFRCSELLAGSVCFAEWGRWCGSHWTGWLKDEWHGAESVRVLLGKLGNETVELGRADGMQTWGRSGSEAQEKVGLWKESESTQNLYRARCFSRVHCLKTHTRLLH